MDSSDTETASPATWLKALRSDDYVIRDRAIRDLQSLLLGATGYEVRRRQAALSHIGSDEIHDLAVQAADDALVAVISKLDGFRGGSRFTTWVYKFAMLEAGVRLRRRAWQEREITIEPAIWPTFRDGRPSAHQCAETTELLEAIGRAVTESLTDRQREVFCALVLNDVPIDALAERMNTTRGALYKALHDSRRKLRTELAAAGLVASAAITA
jgi:RNA polymerase sigma-70 factor, ECF subfamily